MSLSPTKQERAAVIKTPSVPAPVETILIRPACKVARWQIRCQRWPAFLLSGIAAVVLTLPQSWILVRNTSLSMMVVLLILVNCIVACLCLVMVTKILTGNETLTYYHHMICAGTVAFIVVRAMGVPVLPYLDITVLGLALILACGRVGCLLAGCCHGRPSRWGIAYSHGHIQEGFPPYLVGVKLFPVQALESIYALGLTAVGMGLVLRQSPPGTVLSFYVVGYALGRFWIEFARGDTQRAYFLGFSRAQWTSLVLLSALTGAERAGFVPTHRWSVAVLVFVSSSLVIIALIRRLIKDSKSELGHPRHVGELAGALSLLNTTDPHRHRSTCTYGANTNLVHLAETSIGLKLSVSTIVDGQRLRRQYTLSKTNGVLKTEWAKRLAVLIVQLTCSSKPGQLLRTDSGVFHLLLEPESRDNHKPLR